VHYQSPEQRHNLTTEIDTTGIAYGGRTTRQEIAAILATGYMRLVRSRPVQQEIGPPAADISSTRKQAEIPHNSLDFART